jgi:hypothetical protein
LRRGQEKSTARIGDTRKLFDEPTTQKAPALKGCVLAGVCCVAALDRCPCIAFAPLLAFTTPERNAGCFYLGRSCSGPSEPL